MAATEIILDTTRLDAIAAALNVNVERVGVRFALQVQQTAAQNAPYDTGALQNSIITVTKSEDGNSEGAGAASARNPKVEIVTVPKPTGDAEIANVGPVVAYGVYQELGTSRMAAQPYLLPAAVALRGRYNSGAEWRSIVGE